MISVSELNYTIVLCMPLKADDNLSLYDILGHINNKAANEKLLLTR